LAVVRARILRSALDVIAAEGYGNLSPLRIVDRAAVSIDTFFGLFGDVEDCVSAALVGLSDELLGTVSWRDPHTPEPWPLRVRLALGSLMDHLAAHPSHAHVIATGAFEMGPAGVNLSLELAAKVARALLAGAPGALAGSGGALSSGGDLAREGVAGAVWHTVYCHAVHNRTEMLPASVDQLAYLTLAPFLGADQAVQALLSERARASPNLSRPSDLARHRAERCVSEAAL
jgi:AcrR family transcriptional regulator